MTDTVIVPRWAVEYVLMRKDWNENWITGKPLPAIEALRRALDTKDDRASELAQRATTEQGR